MATAVPETVAPLTGVVIDTVGGVASTTLATVTDTTAAVVVLPEVSRATAVRTCWPLVAVVLFQVMEYAPLVISAPRFTPSSLNTGHPDVVRRAGQHRHVAEDRRTVGWRKYRDGWRSRVANHRHRSRQCEIAVPFDRNPDNSVYHCLIRSAI